MTTQKTEQELTAMIYERENTLYSSRMQLLDIYAKERGWTANGMDVLYLLLAEKYHWTPSQVRSLTQEEQGLFVEVLTSPAKQKGVC